MKLTARYYKKNLNFKRPSGTSRGIMHKKETFFIEIKKNGKKGIGECGLLRGLSIDDVKDYETTLKWTCENINLGLEVLYKRLNSYPSIQFGLEIAFTSLKADNLYHLFPSDFTNGITAIPINGLIWMGDKAFMTTQIKEKIKAGFTCIKLKIGSIDFNTELDILAQIRSEFTDQDIEIRVDANGAFSAEDALDKLKRLSEFQLHSIEQPIKPGQLEDMYNLCEQSPLPIALDEELIGFFDVTKKKKLLQTIQPQYIILKPSLVGGYCGSKEWMEQANQLKIGWWVTSALESNIGLNAIAQWVFGLKTTLHQGLGTGSLFTNNFKSPLTVIQGTLQYNPAVRWDVNLEELCI